MRYAEEYAARNVPCVILAGGEAKRFGRPKGLAKLHGRPLLDCIAQRLKPQTSASIVVNAPLDGAYSELGYELAPDDKFVGQGPLAGLRTAMAYARACDHDCVATVPIDTPLVPLHFIESLSGEGIPAVASSANQVHPICGLWSVQLLNQLELFLADGHRSVQKWVRQCQANIVDFEIKLGLDPFLNINTPADLEVVAELGAKQ